MLKVSVSSVCFQTLHSNYLQAAVKANVTQCTANQILQHANMISTQNIHDGNPSPEVLLVPIEHDTVTSDNVCDGGYTNRDKLFFSAIATVPHTHQQMHAAFHTRRSETPLRP